ncbi:uncharacterized protein LOC124266886 isoform X3 [Haliotis rubra]|uniref:uncharacterized protein LOC124266886 isoform X3 n=1 Tax=Haliotis rubra TaxID=36100 RepID=UPI001EE53A2B|nr:uncharacterized protein LOC124266886 isoform X3 [Haliotis rubra]
MSRCFNQKIYTDYYLPERDIWDMKKRLIYSGKDRVWGLDVWRDLQERRRWAVANGPSLSLDINVNPRGRRNRSSENASASGFMLGLSHGIYLTHRIRRPCTVDIPCPIISVNIRDGVCLCKGRARLERVRRRSPFSPAVVAIHLDLPDEEPSRKFKDLSNHLARVVEEPDDRGIFFWFIKRGQWNTPIRGTSAYFIDLDGKHKKYKIHARDCLKLVVVLSERTHLSSPLPSSSRSPPALSPSRSPSTDSNQPPRRGRPSPSSTDSNQPPRRGRPSPSSTDSNQPPRRGRPSPSSTDSNQPPRRGRPSPSRIETKENQAEEQRIETQAKKPQAEEQRIETQAKKPQAEEPRNQAHRHVQTSDPPPLVPGEEVLARWEDDRWYYKGRIVQCMDNDHYKVKDTTGRDDIISRDDIVRITDPYDTVSSHKRASGCVLARHPIYYWSYAPGRVVETLGQHLTVRFYDNNQKNINRWDVYAARDREKHDKDVAEIRQREKDWEGLQAFIRDESGVYKLGTIEKQIGRQQKYSVRWGDGKCSEQMSIHIYGTYTPMIKFKVGSYILARADPDRIHFLPGQVRNVHRDGDDQRLEVEFVNGKSLKNVLFKHSYWMNKMAFHEAEEMFLRHHQDMSDEEDSPRYG